MLNNGFSSKIASSYSQMIFWWIFSNYCFQRNKSVKSINKIKISLHYITLAVCVVLGPPSWVKIRCGRPEISLERNPHWNLNVQITITWILWKTQNIYAYISLSVIFNSMQCLQWFQKTYQILYQMKTSIMA